MPNLLLLLLHSLEPWKRKLVKSNMATTSTTYVHLNSVLKLHVSIHGLKLHRFISISPNPQISIVTASDPSIASKRPTSSGMPRTPLQCKHRRGWQWPWRYALGKHQCHGCLIFASWQSKQRDTSRYFECKRVFLTADSLRQMARISIPACNLIYKHVSEFLSSFEIAWEFQPTQLLSFPSKRVRWNFVGRAVLRNAFCHVWSG